MEIEKLRKLLKEQNISQRDLARRIGVDERHIAVWVNRKSIPKVQIKKVANALGVTADYLLD